MTNPSLTIKTADINDLQALEALGYSHDAGYYERCFEEQDAGKREIVLAIWEGQLAGYAFLNWNPRYQPFRRLEIPEIQDLYVAPDMRRKGIGEALIFACEGRALDKGCTQMGMAVGLHSGFGAAQRLYVRLGYVPDGSGITYDRDAVRVGEMRAIDDELTLMMVKDLNK